MATKAKKPVKAKAVKAAKSVKKPIKKVVKQKPANVKVSKKKVVTVKTKKTAPKKNVKSVKATKTIKKIKTTKPVKTTKMPIAKKTMLKKAAPIRVAAAKVTKPKAPVKSAVKPTPKKAAPIQQVKKPLPPKTIKIPKQMSKPTPKAETKHATKKSTSASRAEPTLVASTATTLIGLDLLPYKEISGEEYMNIQQKDHFRTILLKWKEQLLQEMDRTVHHLQDEVVNLPDPNDRATQEEEFSLELRARDRERKLIKKIEETLQKVEENEYGYCDSCGVEIGIRRLEARPTANLCIDCKTLDEIRERQMWG